MAYLLRKRKSFYTTVIFYFVVSWKPRIDNNRQNSSGKETWIPFQLANDSIATAKIYEIIGKQIRIIKFGGIETGNLCGV